MSIRLCAVMTLGETGSESLKQEVAEALCGAARRLEEIRFSHAGVHLPGVFGAGDLTWDFLVEDAAALASLRTRFAEPAQDQWIAVLGDESLARQAQCRFYAAVLEPISSRAERPNAFAIKRTNLVRVRRDASPTSVRQWSEEVPLLADHVPAIRNWSLSRVVEFLGDSPPAEWTHAWEQEFETLEGLTEDYMMSPYHWGHLDGWYDPEMPWSIVEPELAHLFCAANESVLCWSGKSSVEMQRT